MEHTPGPWRIVWDNKDEGPCFWHDSGTPMDESRAEADCQLIEAAPDLLDVLKMIERQLGLCGSLVRPGDVFHELCKKAIAQAEGK